MAIRSRVQLRKDTERQRQAEKTEQAVAKAAQNKQKGLHPVNRYRQIRDDTNAAIQKRKQQLLNDEQVPDYQGEKLKFMLIILGIMALLTIYTVLM